MVPIELKELEDEMSPLNRAGLNFARYLKGHMSQFPDLGYTENEILVSACRFVTDSLPHCTGLSSKERELIKEQGKKRCNGCNSFLIPYGTWIISDLSEEEIKRSEEFIKEHRHNGKPVIDYIIHDSNGISCNIYIMCIICGKEKDITDYDRW